MLQEKVQLYVIGGRIGPCCGGFDHSGNSKNNDSIHEKSMSYKRGLYRLACLAARGDGMGMIDLSGTNI